MNRSMLAILLLVVAATSAPPPRNGWFPAFSPDAKFLGTGNVDIWTSNGDGSALYDTKLNGGKVHWLDNSTIVFAGPTAQYPQIWSPLILKYPFNQPPIAPVPALGCNLIAGGGGIWGCYTATGDFPVTLSDGRRFPMRSLGWISANGVMITVDRSGTKIFRTDKTTDVLIDNWPDFVIDPYISEDGTHLVWSRFIKNVGRRTFGVIYGSGQPPQDLTIRSPNEFQPQAITIPGNGTWVMNYDMNSLYIRMWGSKNVIPLHSGDSHYPHAAWDNTAKVLRIAFSDARGNAGVMAVPLLSM